MHFEVWAKGLATLNVDCLVLGIFEEGELADEAQSIDTASGGRLKKLLSRGDFSGRTGETLLLDVTAAEGRRYGEFADAQRSAAEASCRRHGVAFIPASTSRSPLDLLFDPRSELRLTAAAS